MLPKRALSSAFLALLFLANSALAGAQAYTKIVVFGDSLSDTGNDTTVSAAKYGPTAAVPSPYTGYNTGRFTDGMDTIPAAHNYFGVWLEQLAAMLPAKPTILNSLAGGTNYAYGFATTNTGQSTFTYPPPNTALSFQVSNMGAQVASYLATNPTIDNKTLFIVWGGANDLIAATTPQDIVNAAQRDAGIVQQLINAGATDFIVPNLPPLGLVPRFNGSATTSVPASQAAQGFDQALAQYLAGIPLQNPGKTLHIYPLDTYTLFNTIVAAPANQGFANVTMPSSAAYAVANAGINPDTYLFWDDLHPTTRGHNLIALAAMTLLGTPVSTTTTLSSSNLNANQNANVTFTATVNSTTGVPTGTVTFTDGGTVLGSSVVTGTGMSATATYSTSTLSATTHSIQATFTGANGYTNSMSSTLSEVVSAPAFTTSVPSAALTIKSGSSGTVTLTVLPVGGLTGTATFACGPLPLHFSCSVNPISVVLSGSNTPVTTTVTIGTSASLASLERPRGPGQFDKVIFAFALPCFGLLGLGVVRRGKRSLKKVVLAGTLLALCGAGVLGVSGCADSNSASPGMYTVSVITRVNGTATTSNIQVTVQ